jgi:hypothetical protein
MARTAEKKSLRSMVVLAVEIYRAMLAVTAVAYCSRLLAGYVSGDETIFMNSFTLEAGEIVLGNS